MSSSRLEEERRRLDAGAGARVEAAKRLARQEGQVLRAGGAEAARVLGQVRGAGGLGLGEVGVLLAAVDHARAGGREAGALVEVRGEGRRRGRGEGEKREAAEEMRAEEGKRGCPDIRRMPPRPRPATSSSSPWPFHRTCSRACSASP